MNEVVTTKHTGNGDRLKRLAELNALGQTLLEVTRGAATVQTASTGQIGAVEKGPEKSKAAKVLGKATLDRGKATGPEFISPLAVFQLLEQSVGQESWRFYQKGPGAGALEYFQTLAPADVKDLGERMSKLAGQTGIHSGTREQLRKWSRLLIDCASLGITQVWRWSPMRLEQIIKERRAALKPDLSRRLVVVMKGFHDSKAALLESGIQKGLMDSDKNRVLVFEVRSQKDVQAALERLHAAGLKLDGLVISAHAHPHGALLDKRADLFADEDWLKLKYFRDGASIVWEGCNTGFGGKGADHLGTHTRSVLYKQGQSSTIRIFSASNSISAGGTANSQSKVILGQQGEILNIIWKYLGKDVETVQSRRPGQPNLTG